MPTPAKKTIRKPASAATVATAPNAIELLKADHKEVKGMFKDYQKLVDSEAEHDEKQVLAEQICIGLTAHAQVEEELFYPAARQVLGEDVDLVDEADVEHAGAKDLIAQIQSASPEDDHYDAKVKVLGEYIDHHVKEEEGEMFPKLAKTDLDLDSLGAEMAARKDELLDELMGAAVVG